MGQRPLTQSISRARPWLIYIGIVVWALIPFLLINISHVDDDRVAVILIWTLAVTATIQASVHIALGIVTWRQHHTTPVGQALTMREIFQGAKQAFMIVFHIMLGILVSFGFLPFNEQIRAYLYYLIGTFAVGASWYGVVLAYRMHEENWGRAERVRELTRQVEYLEARHEDLERRITGQQTEYDDGG